MKKYHSVLTIAGSDCSGGAGIQADIKTISAMGCYAASVITVLTSQNTVGVKEICEIPSTFVASQLDAVFEDIQIDAVKVGMLYSKAAISAVGDALVKWKPSFIVIDPVMISKSGVPLVHKTTMEDVKNKLFPLSTLITPNIHEAEYLINGSIKKLSDSATKKRASFPNPSYYCGFMHFKGKLNTRYRG